jgi:hypothetical protein
VRGVIGVAGLSGVRAATVFFAMVWGSELVTLPRLGVGVPPVWRWDPAEIGVDALHHLVYASVTSVVCDRLG